MKNLNPIKLILYGILIWVVRVALLLPFLNENGQLPISATDERLPANAEYFFSVLIFVETIVPLFACWRIFRKTEKADFLQKGVIIALFFVVAVSCLDILFRVVISGDTLGKYFINVFIDYAPFALIPIFVGLTLDSVVGDG
jgi:hypothetical protein